MNSSSRQILESFDHLPEPGKREVACEILRRAVELNLPPLTDEDLTRIAEECFLKLDEEERAS